MRSSLASVLLLIGGFSSVFAGEASAAARKDARATAAIVQQAASGRALSAAFKKNPTLATFKRQQFDALNNTLDLVAANSIEYSNHNPDAGKTTTRSTSGWRGITKAVKEMRAFHDAQNAALKATNIESVPYPQRGKVYAADQAARQKKAEQLFAPLGITWSDAIHMTLKGQDSVYVRSSSTEVAPEYSYDHRVPLAENILQKAVIGAKAKSEPNRNTTYFADYTAKLKEVRKSPAAMLKFMHEGASKWDGVESLGFEAAHQDTMHFTLYKDLASLMMQEKYPGARVGDKLGRTHTMDLGLKASLAEAHSTMTLAATSR